MFPSFMVVPLHFTIEFLGFLVAGGASLLVLSRPQLVPGPAFNRVSAALGFAMLAAAQVLHGGAFSIEHGEVLNGQFDGDEVIVALRALAFAFVLIGLVGGLRVGPAALATFRLHEPLLLAPAGAAFVLALLALIGWRRGASRGLGRLGLAALLFSISEVLSAAAPLATIGIGAPNPYAYGAHGVKVLAYIALGSWLWTGVRLSIRSRFVASFVALLVAVVLVLSTALTGVISNSVERQEKSQVQEQVSDAARSLRFREARELLLKATTIAGSVERVGGLYAPGTGLDDLAARFNALPAFHEDFLLFATPRGRLLSGTGDRPVKRAGAKDKPLTAIELLRIVGSDVVDEVVRGSDSSSSVDRIEDWVAVVAAVEIENPTRPNTRDGIVVIGRYVDRLTIEQIANTAGLARASLVTEKNVVASTLPGNPSASDIVPRDVRPLVAAGAAEPQRQTIAGRSYYSAFAPLETANGSFIGTLVLSSPERIVTQTREEVTRVLFLVALGVAVVALALAWLSGRRITRPIQALTATAQEVREGNLNTQARVVGEDEVGQLGESFNEMTASLLRMTNDLREAAREEHRLRARIETIIQSMADGLVAVDADLKVLAFNREAEKLTGIKAANAIGRSVEKVLNPCDAEGRPLPLPIFRLAEGSVSSVFLQRRGDSVPVAFTSAVLRGEDGEVAGAVAVFRDLSREREVERMKSEFLSNISHELRTPLTPIKGYAEILERKNVPAEKQQRFVKGILDSTIRLERIVELLVDFAALEAGRLAPRSTPVEIGVLIERLAKEWEERTPKHKVVASVSGRLPKVIGDERLLRRSIEEVLDNAVKFSPRGGTIRLEARGAASSNGAGNAGRIERRRSPRAVEVTVVDEGIGISEDQLPKIFSDFHQLDGSETRAYGGLGLGLAFVQRIVEAHDGSVKVESEPDRGTKLTISIPAVTGKRRDDE